VEQEELKLTLTLQQILNKHLDELIDQDRFNGYQIRILKALQKCKTSQLGLHKEACDSCGVVNIHYNSCGNRHCPGCQGAVRERWLLDREHDLFDTFYHHVTFTVPAELRVLFKWNKKLLYDVLFESMWATLLSFSKNPQSRLMAEIGVISILHTWTQKLEYHPHVHCMIPSGGLTSAGHWKPKSGKFLFHVGCLGTTFRKNFCKKLEELYKGNLLKFKQPISSDEFAIFVHSLRQKAWVVNSKPGFKGKSSILEYLGRYTHKIAISNYRLIKLENGIVTFNYRDRKAGDVKRIMKLEVSVFLRRFAQHFLPRYFVKIRHYGLFSTRVKKEKLALVRASIKEPIPTKKQKLTIQEVILKTTGVDVKTCPDCEQGKMQVIEIRPPPRGSPRRIFIEKRAQEKQGINE
jgi:hypothetical protein